MKNYIIHVGLHKTGSTFLQEEIFPLIKNFSFVSRPFTQHNHAFNKLQYAPDGVYEENEMVEELKNIKGDNVLLSDEAFSGKVIYFNYINRDQIIRRFKKLFPKATIIIFIRGQADIIKSNYNQYIKAGGTKKIEEYVWASKEDFTYDDYVNKGKLPDIKSLYYNTNDYFVNMDNFLYSNIINSFKINFKNVEVFLYEDIKNNPERLTRKMKKIFGDNFDDRNFKNISITSKINESFGEKKLKKQYFKNNFGYLVSLVLRFFPFFKYKDFGKIDFLNEEIKLHYINDNKIILSKFPEINIGDYPDKYQTKV